MGVSLWIDNFSLPSSRGGCMGKAAAQWSWKDIKETGIGEEGSRDDQQMMKNLQAVIPTYNLCNVPHTVISMLMWPRYRVCTWRLYFNFLGCARRADDWGKECSLFRISKRLGWSLIIVGSHGLLLRVLLLQKLQNSWVFSVINKILKIFALCTIVVTTTVSFIDRRLTDWLCRSGNQNRA